jgi:hypothetical protein
MSHHNVCRCNADTDWLWLISSDHTFLLNKSIWNKEELPDQWKESVIVPVHKKGDKTD